MKFWVVTFALILATGPVIASELSFADAKANADRIENGLSSGEMKRLVDAQGRLAQSAFPYCINNTGQPPTNFTVVVEIGTDGEVAMSWLDKETAFGSCFRERMVQDFSFEPASLPFFTSFEYSNTR